MPLADIVEALIIVPGALKELIQECLSLIRVAHKMSGGSPTQLDGEIDDPEGIVGDMLAHHNAADFAHSTAKLAAEALNYL